MDFKALYLSTEGRISRQTWWIGAIILAVINVVVTLVLLPLVGMGMPDMGKLAAAGSDAAAISAAVGAAVQGAAWGSLVIFIILAYPAYCLSVKRRHDKNNAGRDVIIYFAVSFILVLIQALGFGYTMGDVGGVPLPQPSMLYMLVGIVGGVFGLYMLVVLGFLKGTSGANDFGPDPLGG
jgi:uncharacterized membrane protein YhaH (DUF805 family)